MYGKQLFEEYMDVLKDPKAFAIHAKCYNNCKHSKSNNVTLITEFVVH